MVSVYPILSLLLTLALALLVIRIGSIAFRMTGMSPEVASFQAASAFTGVGFTTDEAEQITATPDRRNVAKHLFRLGSLGAVSAITSLVTSFTNGGNLRSVFYIVGGSIALLMLARSRVLNTALTPIIERALDRTTDLSIRDYTQVLGLRDDYRIAEVDAASRDWLTDKSLRELDLPAEGVRVLAIERDDGSFVGAPGADTEILSGDKVVLYGQEHRLQELSERHADDVEAREAAVEDHRRREANKREPTRRESDRRTANQRESDGRETA